MLLGFSQTVARRFLIRSPGGALVRLMKFGKRFLAARNVPSTFTWIIRCGQRTSRLLLLAPARARSHPSINHRVSYSLPPPCATQALKRVSIQSATVNIISVSTSYYWTCEVVVQYSICHSLRSYHSLTRRCRQWRLQLATQTG